MTAGGAVRRIATPTPATSLFWDSDALVDVAGGGRRWDADGTASPAIVGWGFPFDRALVSPSGRFHVLYTERGTKGAVLDGDRIVRELNRSFSHALDYDFPVALGRLPDGREIVAYCPEHGNRIEVDELATGDRLTTGDRRPHDVFHSRLAVSPDGRHLLSAGWVWHPYGIGSVFDLTAALTDPSELDGHGLLSPHEAVDAEVAAAAWLDDDRLVVAASTEEPLDGDEAGALGPGELGVWSLSEGVWLSRTAVPYGAGTLLARGGEIVGLHGCPRLIDPLTGAVLAEWPDVPVGTKNDSYGVTHLPTPVAALHPDGRRLAVAQPDHIAVLTLPPGPHRDQPVASRRRSARATGPR